MCDGQRESKEGGDGWQRRLSYIARPYRGRRGRRSWHIPVLPYIFMHGGDIFPFFNKSTRLKRLENMSEIRTYLTIKLLN